VTQTQNPNHSSQIAIILQRIQYYSRDSDDGIFDCLFLKIQTETGDIVS